jgi:diguanylate cyclase (GGDEF)-like protein
MTAFRKAASAPDQAMRSRSSDVPAGSMHGTHLAHSAFWIMTRRVTLMAASVDAAFLVLFLLLDSPWLAWLNVVSIALYLGAWWCLKRRINQPALLMIWIEVIGHATIGTLLIGWEAGFFYYLFLFIPAIVVGRGRRTPVVLLTFLLVFYLGLHALARSTGPIEPLESDLAVSFVHGFNVIIVFSMAALTANHYYGTVRRAERRLMKMATTDPLTGLVNRRSLIAQADTFIRQGNADAQSTALVLADIDHFKRVNDQYGHEAGDHILEQVANILNRVARSGDIVARWGGEEFLIFLPSTGLDSALLLAERIREAVAAEALDHAGTSIQITVSLGVAELTPDEPLGEAIARADRGLYASKTGGRNRVSDGKPNTGQDPLMA